MKTLLTLLAALAFLLPASGEVFIGPTSSTNRLLIATNEAIFITAATSVGRIGYDINSVQVPLGDPSAIRTNTRVGFAVNIGLVSNGATNVMTIPTSPTGPFVIAGPAELISSDNGAFIKDIVSFKRVQGTNITTHVVTNGPPVTINVPSGKTIRFFAPLNVSDRIVTPVEDLSPGYVSFSPEYAEPRRLALGVTLQKGSQTAETLIYAGQEFAGPLTLTIGPRGIISRPVVSYYLTEDFLPLPAQGVLQGGTGSHQIIFERSLDLLNWEPVVTHPTSTDVKTFYRVRIQK